MKNHVTKIFVAGILFFVIMIFNSLTQASPNNSYRAFSQESMLDDNEDNQHYLMDVCPPYKVGTGYLKDMTSFKMAGKEYGHGFALNNGDWFASNDSFAIFNLNGKYQELSFIVGHIDGTYQAEAILNIILDNITVKRIQINYNDMPQSFIIPLNGAIQMKIHKDDRNGGGYGFADIIVR